MLTYVMGDLNADLLKPDDAETRALLNLVEKYSLKIVKHGTTHHTRTTITNSDTHIDVILVDEQNTFCCCAARAKSKSALKHREPEQSVSWILHSTS